MWVAPASRAVYALAIAKENSKTFERKVSRKISIGTLTHASIIMQVNFDVAAYNSPEGSY